MQLNFKVKKTPEIVFEYLSNTEKFVSVHPLITKIIKTQNGYLVYETLKFGFIPISFSYPVIIDRFPDQNIIKMQAVVMKFTYIKMEFKIQKQQNYSVITETIDIKSVFPIKKLIQHIFKKQHIQLFKNIENANDFDLLK